MRRADHSLTRVLRLWCVVVCDLETSRMRRQGPRLAEVPQGKKLCSYTHIHNYIDYGGIYCASKSWNSVVTLQHVIMVTDSNTKWLLIPKTVCFWEEVDLLVSIVNPVLACKVCDKRHRLAHLASRDISARTTQPHDTWQYTWQYKQELQGHQFTVRHDIDW
jgi:hypothetical protein